MKKFLFSSVILLFAFAVILYFAFHSETALEKYRGFIAWIGRYETLKYWIFLAFYIFSPLFLFPVIVLTLTSGVLFGAVTGSAIASAGSLLSAALAFGLGRLFARSWILRKIESKAKYRAIDHAVGKRGWKIVFLLRLTPFFPFAVVNFSLGSTKIRFLEYCTATWAGMFPGIIVYTFLGSLLEGIAALVLAGRQITPWEWGLSAVGTGALFLLFFYIIRVAKKALREAVPEAVP